MSDVKTDLTLPAFNDRSERAVRFGCVVCQTSGVCENERMAPLNLQEQPNDVIIQLRFVYSFMCDVFGV